MENSEYWKKFESSGQIEHYMQFKQGEAVACSAPQRENADANYNNGAGAARDQNGRK